MNTYLRAGGGSEGWGVGAAIGAKLAAGDTPVVGFVGDGSFYYADSGLWTSVHHNIPVLYIITNNGAYGIVAGFYGRAGGGMSDTGKYGGVVLDGIDPLKIANGFGMDGEAVDDEDEVEKAVKRGLEIVTEQDRPYLLEFKLPLGLPEGGVADTQYRMR
jgi:thiamine pyrophosphate-dependent acetolactate synthase large subunit-like protein